MRLAACTLLAASVWILTAQERPAPGAVNVSVLEGDGAINSIRLRRAHEPVVRVTDAAGAPIAAATVNFLLPDSGASGTFLNGQLNYTAQTDDQGRATGKGLRPNSNEGQFTIRVSAQAHGSVGTATLSQTNAEPVVRTSHTKLITILAVIGGAAAGGAVLAARGKSSSTDTTTTTPPPVGGTISAGTPAFGPPH